ncbi:MAG: tetratricopeptide repeat protein [Candidatus Omnitrophica bacterium]|nr:tetratricopeptide repeat protein [Candidatus Omnitrophota bacterium]
MKILKIIFNRMFFIYLAAYLAINASCDKTKADYKVLNWLRGSARYVNDYADGTGKKDLVSFYEASEYYKKLPRVMPDLPFSFGALGYCYYQLGDFKRSKEAYQKAALRNPEFFGAYYNLGLIYSQEGKEKEASDYFKKAVSTGVNSSLRYFVLAAEKQFIDIVRRKEWVRQKEKELVGAYSQSVKNVLAGLEAKGQFKEIIYLSQQVLKAGDIMDKDVICFYAGKAAYQLKGYKQSLEYFNTAIDLNKNYKEAYLEAGRLLDEIGKKDLAAAYFKKSEEAVNQEPIEPKRNLIFYPPIYELGRR